MIKRILSLSIIFYLIKRIEYNEFVRDLKNNVSFDNPELINGDLTKLDGYTCAMNVDSSLCDEIFALNKSEPSDFFEYQGQRFSFYGGRLTCYSKEPLLRNVYGGDNHTINNIKIKVKKSLEFHEKINIEIIGVEYSFFKVSSKELINDIIKCIKNELSDYFAFATNHLLDFKYDTSKLSHMENEYISSIKHDDFSYDFFKSKYDIEKAFEHLLNQFDPVLSNKLYHERCARSVAVCFSKAKKSIKGIVFRSWGSYDRAFNNHHKESNLRAAMNSFKYNNNLKGMEIMKSMMSKQIMPGQKVEDSGFICKAFKEHYTLLVPYQYVKDMVLYANKYAPDIMKQKYDQNKDLAA